MSGRAGADEVMVPGHVAYAWRQEAKELAAQVAALQAANQHTDLEAALVETALAWQMAKDEKRWDDADDALWDVLMVCRAVRQAREQEATDGR